MCACKKPRHSKIYTLMDCCCSCRCCRSAARRCTSFKLTDSALTIARDWQVVRATPSHPASSALPRPCAMRHPLFFIWDIAAPHPDLVQHTPMSICARVASCSLRPIIICYMHWYICSLFVRLCTDSALFVRALNPPACKLDVFLDCVSSDRLRNK